MSQDTAMHDFAATFDRINARRHIARRDPAIDDPSAMAEAIEVGPCAGQIWLAKGPWEDDESQYALIAGVEDDPRLVSVVPMSNDETLGSADALLLGDTPLGVRMVAWPEYRTVIPVRLLLRPMGTLSDDALHAVVDDRPDESASVVRGDNSRDGDSRGDDVAGTRADDDFDELMATFIHWHDQCAALPRLQGDGDGQLRLTPGRGDYLRRLVQVLGLTPEQAGRIIDGEDRLSEEQAMQLRAAGVDTERDWRRTMRLPDDLLIEVEQPVWRAAAQAMDRHPDRDARMELAQEAYALAARTNGHGREAWRGALEAVSR